MKIHGNAKWLPLLAALALAACGPGGGSSTAGTATKPPVPYDLIRAEHPACQQAGTMAATYLDTRRPTDLDAAWGNQRQQVLQLSGERRALYIRQQADGYIQRCDQNASQAEAAAAEAKAEAEAKVKAAKVEANAQTNCGKVGAAWKTNFRSCEIAYRGGDGALYYYTIKFDADGNITAGSPSLYPQDQSPDACAKYGKELGFQTTWHADTMICAI